MERNSVDWCSCPIRVWICLPMHKRWFMITTPSTSIYTDSDTSANKIKREKKPKQ
ncbi:hypothetical protein M5D96_008046 [Drosophila gunungcola]|uniref:Uncharacterized protein n=1 Tax=Drosophila gunungcola TaxID=103775 RepID=A0A9P9YMF8_9MUSC|nr:hypothetical protein M5D96_008046 [Drosophila gunungcola]